MIFFHMNIMLWKSKLKHSRKIIFRAHRPWLSKPCRKQYLNNSDISPNSRFQSDRNRSIDLQHQIFLLRSQRKGDGIRNRKDYRMWGNYGTKHKLLLQSPHILFWLELWSITLYKTNWLLLDYSFVNNLQWSSMIQRVARLAVLISNKFFHN